MNWSEHDTRRIVVDADADSGISLWSVCGYVLAAGLFVWLILAYAPGCIERDNELLEAQQAAMQKEKPHNSAEAYQMIGEQR